MQFIYSTCPPGWCAINHLYLVGWASVGTTVMAVGRWWANLHYCLGSFMYIHWYYCVLHSIPLMYFTESLYVILSSRIYFEFYVYLWDIPRCVACWFYVFLCTLSEMTNKTCTIIYSVLNEHFSLVKYLCTHIFYRRSQEAIEWLWIQPFHSVIFHAN